MTSASNLRPALLGFSLLAGLLLPAAGHAAPCCAGGSALPALISGDQAAQFGASFAQSAVIGNAPAVGIPVFRASENVERTETLSLDAAALVSDRWQAGLSVPLVRRLIRTNSLHANATGFGDIRASLGYEAWPEYTYSEWKPRGFVFAQFILPTGGSLDTATLSGADGAVNARGQGVYSIALGTLLVKRWSSWDTFFAPEIHYNFPRSFEDEKVAGRTGGSLSWGLGWSPSGGAIRIGLRIQPAYQQGKTTSQDGRIQTASYQLSWNTALDLTYLYGADWSFSASYNDQTLIGPAVNAPLNRGFSIALQRKWDR